MIDSDVVWYITKEINNKIYYLQNYDDKRGMSLWTPKKAAAIGFETSIIANEFCKHFLRNRTDVLIKQSE